MSVPEKSLEEIGGDILAALPDSRSPDELTQRMQAVYDIADKHMRRVRWHFLIEAGLCVEDTLKEHAQLDKDALLRAIANEFIHCAAFFVRSLKRRAGDDISAARFALVAYAIGDQVRQREWSDAEGADIVGDSGSLRDALKELAAEKQAPEDVP